MCAYRRQPIPGPLFDQQIDQRQSLLFVDRLGKELPIAMIVESNVLLTHVVAPATHTPLKLEEAFRKPGMAASASIRDINC